MDPVCSIHDRDLDLKGACDIVLIVSLPILPLNEMSVAEKVQTMEALWQSLSVDPAAVESPAWHEEELRERERKIEAGEAKFILSGRTHENSCRDRGLAAQISTR